MASSEEVGQPSPWLSVWLRPRQTIESIIAGPPRRVVLLLASLGAISGMVAELLHFVGVSTFLNWRVLFGLAVAGPVIGIINLYIVAAVFKGVGGLMGGHASRPDLRAAIAWAMAPGILGLVVVAVILALWYLLGGKSVSSELTLTLQAIISICGLWSLIMLLLMLARVEGFGFWRTTATYILSLILPALVIALLVRTLLFQPFSLPSVSMTPTLLLGDQFFVSKYAYGYSHFSLPFSPPLFSGRIFATEPARGDVVVFRLPRDGVTDYVKRVVGLPGDRIQMKNGQLYINDVAVMRERLEDFAGGEVCGAGSAARVKRWRETLPNGASYETLDCIDNGFYDNTNIFAVPAGQYFVLGDNRDNSSDSRMLSAVGYIPLENFIGRVIMIFASTAPGAVHRVGLMVH